VKIPPVPAISKKNPRKSFESSANFQNPTTTHPSNFRFNYLGTMYMNHAPSDTIRTTEQELIEMGQQFKERMEEKNKEHLELKTRYMEAKKLIAHLYGITRSLQEEADSSINDGILIDWLIAEIRSHCSDFLFKDEEIRLDIYGY